jgi:hypothetical protein
MIYAKKLAGIDRLVPRSARFALHYHRDERIRLQLNQEAGCSPD